jgi:hypothetical protein
MDSPEISIVQPWEDLDTRWSRSNRYFDEAFLTNDFDHACDVCDRLWFRKGLKSPTTNHVAVLRTEFDDPNLSEFSVCNICRRSLNSKEIPPLAKTRGVRYPPKPRGLPNLDPISERLISPRLPFMQIRRLRHSRSSDQRNCRCKQYGSPASTTTWRGLCIQCEHKSVYLHGFVRNQSLELG